MTEYGIYKGDQVLVVGTAKQCAEALKVDLRTIQFYASSVHKKRVEKSADPNERIIAVKIEKEDTEDDTHTSASHNFTNDQTEQA